MNYLHNCFCVLLKGAVCRIDLGIAVQIQNIGDYYILEKILEKYFFHQPLLLRFDARAGCQINDTNRNVMMNEMKYSVFSANWQPVVPKYYWVNWQWAGFTNHNKHRHSGPDVHFQRRITDCSIVFQINKYVNLTCFLTVCKHIMVFLCFSRVKILHTAPLIRFRCFRLQLSAHLHTDRYIVECRLLFRLILFSAIGSTGRGMLHIFCGCFFYYYY